MNKSDLVPLSELSSLESAVKEINPAAPMYRTVRGEIDLQHIMGISAYARFQAPPPSPEHPKAHVHDHSNEDHTHSAEPTHYELRGISSLQMSCPVLSPSRFDELDEWIRTVLWENRLPEKTDTPDLQVLRCKGLFFTENGDQYVLQGVRNMYEISKIEDQEVMGVPDAGKLVLIGKGLSDVVRQSLYKVVNQ